MFPPEPEVVIVREEPPREVIYKEEPSQEVMQSEFAPMLRDFSQYKITEYYSVKKNLWSELPIWVKDDISVFNRSGQGWVEANESQNPSIVFEKAEKNWKLFADDEGLKLKWVDVNYNDIEYTVAAYEKGKSFTLAKKVNDLKVFFTYTFLGKK